jgi:superfamily II DNA or RNA helicase
MSLQLRDYQSNSIDELRQGFAAGHKAQMLYLPTGGGKTECAISLLDATSKKGNKSAMILDRIILCDQTSQRLQKYNIDHGVLQSGHWRYRPYENIQVCSAQTLEKRGSFPGLSLMIVDEAHSTRAQTVEFIKNNPDIRVIGLSASPFTKGLASIYQNVVCTVTTKKLVDDGVLCPLRVFIAKEIDMTGAKKVAGEWSQSETSKRGMQITGDVVSEWIKMTHEIFGAPKKTIVFCSGVEHGTDLSKKFAEQGYNFISVSYKDDSDFKRDVIEDFSKPDTEIHGLIATDVLTKGFDCVLEGSMVLTDNGLVCIEEVTLDDKIWDGHEFVSHSGAIYKGTRNVITYAGLTATPDHLVKTKEGWVPFGRCANEQIPIVVTGNGWETIQEHEGCFSGVEKDTRQAEVGSNSAFAMRMRGLRHSAMDELEHYSKGILERLSKLHQSKKSTTVACHEVQGNGCTLPEKISQTLRKLWWPWNSIQLQFTSGCCELDSEKSRIAGARSKYSIGQNKQQWSLRARESTMGKQVLKLQQYATRWMGGENAQTSVGASRDKVCRQNSEKSFFSRHDNRADHREVSQKIGQTEGRVWDILNAGPRNSFTCQGLLIHNCADVMIGVSARPFSKSLSSHVQQMGRVMRSFPGKEFAVWLDHSGNYIRFQEEWDDIYSDGVTTLEDGKEKAKKEKTEGEKAAAKCPKCGSLWASGSDSCLHCGYTRERRSMLESVPGEMEELSAGWKHSKEEKQSWYSMTQYMVKNHGWSSGRAAHTYKDKFGIWPKGLTDAPAKPSIEFDKAVKFALIRYLKGKGKK